LHDFQRARIVPRTVFGPTRIHHRENGPQEGSGVYVTTQELLREEPKLTQFAFSRLLEWLDDGVDSNGEVYLEMRRRLESYFDRRNRPFPEDLADATLNRIARTLAGSESISVTPPARYCYVIARFVLLEDLRRGSQHVPLDPARTPGTSGSPSDDREHTAIREQRLACLDRCLEKLKPEQRQLAIEYYRDDRRARIERRRGLADRLGITTNALNIRASRIRSALEACVDDCCRDQ
jgi:DNA-directed RNA polymerase specialized sigma24 family protein